MSQEQSTMYYPYKANLNLDKILNFLKNKGVVIEDRKTKTINAIDQKGDLYQTNYNDIVKNILNNEIIHLVIKLNNSQSSILWRIRTEASFLIYDFYFSYLDDQEINFFLKIIFNIFIKILLLDNKSPGFFIDKDGSTYDFDFDPFFISNKGEIDYLTELICIKKDKLNQIKVNSETAIYELNQDYVCVANDKTFLDFLLAENKT